MDIAGMRKNYESGELEEHRASFNPVEQFASWFADAVKAKVPEPNAMSVATVGSDGRPSSRIVLVKDFDTRGIVWYTNFNSRKGTELHANPHAAVLFHWVKLERTVRIEGTVEKVSDAEADIYFNSRPVDSRIGAWASPQSQVIPNRGVLLSNAAQVSAKYGLHPPRPPWWGGYRLVPDYWEFWQGRKSRLHDRLRYRLVDGEWVRERLAP